MRILRTLNVKLLFPLICLWGLIFLLLFIFVLLPISDFVKKHIEENMQWLAGSVYSICDDSLDDLIRSGRSNEKKQLKIRQIRVLKHIEDFARQNDVLAFVYLAESERVIWRNDLPVEEKYIIPLVTEHNQISQFALAGNSYSGYHFSFDPWQWHIVLVQKNTNYDALISRVGSAYVATAFILFSSLILILLFFNVIIKHPIQKIIAPLKKNIRPNYRGTIEFEFLSKSIENMHASLQNAKIDLELRVKERTRELKRANLDLHTAKEALSRHAEELERQVAERTREINNILKYTPAVVYLKDIDGRYLLVNSRYEELFNVRNTDIRGKHDTDVLPEDIARQFKANDEKVLLERCSYNVEEQIYHEDGVHTYLSVKFPVFSESGEINAICGISTDITAVKRAQQQLRRLSGSIMASQEMERTAVARELHDELGQALTAMHMDAYWLRGKLEKEGVGGAERAAAMCTLIDGTIKNVQNIAIRLRPGVLDDLGLVDALDWYTDDFKKRAQISCIFDYDTIPSINTTIATAAYRITQEALTNVARHASATSVRVHLSRRENHLILRVDDNGRGFDVDAIDEVEGLGLMGMSERAVLAGGSLEILSVPGEGTQISFAVPYR